MGTISFRSDSEVERALAQLMENGRSKTDAIKAALLLAADVERRELIRVEATQVAHDPEDLAEIRAVREDLDVIRAW
jgi:hypothetical protein